MMGEAWGGFSCQRLRTPDLAYTFECIYGRSAIPFTCNILSAGNMAAQYIWLHKVQIVQDSIFTNRFSSFRFPGQQLVTKLVTAPMACSTVMVPTTMFMGQVVTAYSPFAQQPGQTQAIAAPSDSQQHQQGQPQGLTQPQQPFLQVVQKSTSTLTMAQMKLQMILAELFCYCVTIWGETYYTWAVCCLFWVNYSTCFCLLYEGGDLNKGGQIINSQCAFKSYGRPQYLLQNILKLHHECTGASKRSSGRKFWKVSSRAWLFNKKKQEKEKKRYIPNCEHPTEHY